MIINKAIILIVSFLLINGCFDNLSAQELITPLSYNPILNKFPKILHLSYRSIDTFDLDKYSFWDDFSGNNPYPKDSLWIDKNVFINSTLAYRPVSYNTATFDGLDEYGNPYSPGLVNSKGKIADRLTSVPINLSKYKLSDSIYLSFFYQPQGIADAPEEYDSLVLEFKPIRLWAGTFWDSNAWVRIWSAKGSFLKPFQQVIVPVKPYIIDTSQITDTLAEFYYGAFQFRFVNYGSLSGNLDHWHLTYVYLNKGRNSSDTVYKDITVTERPVSILEEYTSMPWKHFNANKNLVRKELKIHAYNLWKTPLNLIGRANIYNLADNKLLMSTGDDKTLYSGDTTLTLAFYMPDSLDLSSVASNDTVVFKTILSSKLIDDRKINDNAEYFQRFENYYAYDDGTAEMGYGIYPGKYSMVAYKYNFQVKIPNEDSLRGIYIYFNRSDQYVGNNAFNILVWNKGDFNTNPVIIESRVPEIADEKDNGYYLFLFDTALAVDNELYIGWEQNSEYYINVGVDMNYYELIDDTFPNNSTGKVFFFANDKWNTSSLKGALMIRPVFSNKKIVINTPETNNDNNLGIYPNPSKNIIHIQRNNECELQYEIVSVDGKKHKSGIVENNNIIITDLSKGFYILMLTENDRQNRKTFKLIITK